MSTIWIAFNEEPWQRKLTGCCLVPSWITRPIPLRCEIVVSVPCVRSTMTCTYCKLETVLCKSDRFHYITFGSDSIRSVWRTVGKHTQKLKKRWVYVKLDTIVLSSVERDFARRVLSFLNQQVGKPFNPSRAPGSSTLMNVICGCSSSGATVDDTDEELLERPVWFCSELVTAALLYGGLDDHITVNPKDTTPAILKRLLLEQVKGSKLVNGTDAILAQKQ